MQQFCFSNAGVDGFDWQVLASSRLSCNHLWYQPRSPPTKLRSKARRENGKYGCRGRQTELFTGESSPNFLHHLGNVIKSRAGRVRFSRQMQSTLPKGSVTKCKSNAGWFEVSQSYQHVHTSHSTDQQPVDVNTICHFSHWDPEKMCPAH